MKSNPQTTKSGCFQPPKSRPRKRKVRKIKSMRPELPESKSRKIPADGGVSRRRRRLSGKFQISMGSVASANNKRRVLTNGPDHAKRFKPSQALQADVSLEESNTDDAILAENDQPNLQPEVDSAGMFLQNQDQEMEQDDDDEDENSNNCAHASKGTSDVDMSLQPMTSSQQIIPNMGINETSLDGSILDGPSNRVENSAASSLMMPQDPERIQCERVTKYECAVPATNGKKTVLTHESVRNYTLELLPGYDASNLSCLDSNMLDSLFYDDDYEVQERFVRHVNETQLRMKQCKSGQNHWNRIEDYSKLLIILAMIFFIFFISMFVIEAEAMR